MPWIRRDYDERYDAVAKVLAGAPGAGVSVVPMMPGTLMLFEGRRSLHRVSPIRGPRARHVALLAYDTRPGAAWATALATPRAGHAAFVAVVRPGLPAKPLTLVVNKAAIAGAQHAGLTWGAAQAGVASGVMDAVAAGDVAPGRVDALALIAAVWVDPEARDADAVYRNNREATARALAAGRRREPALADVLAARAKPGNPFFEA